MHDHDWPQHADHRANAERLGAHLAAERLQRCGRPHRPRERQPGRGVRRCAAASMCVIWCASPASCPKSRGEPPRLYVVTRNAQTVLAGDVANLEQAGLRGLMRVIGTEHPHLRATQIDMDEDTDAEQLARQLLGGLRGGRDRLAKRPVVHGAAEPRSAAPRGAANRRRRPRARRHAPADPHAR